MEQGKERKTVNLNIRITEATKKGLDKLAAADRRTVSDYIRLQLEKLVENSPKK